MGAQSSVLAPVSSSSGEPKCLASVASSNGASGRKPALKSDAILQIQGIRYYVVGAEPLGMGSFGAVWAAERRDGLKGEVAIKEILCRSQKELGDATLEGRLLRMIHSAKPNKLMGKVPDLVAMETETVAADQCLMRLAMTKVPGIQLDTFLELCSAGKAKVGPTSREDDAVASAAAAISSRCQFVPGACRFAHMLLSQLASIFECMSAVVYHRDVSPHNILIDVANPSNPQFGLVDFGLGIDLKSWHGPKGTTSWHFVDIGGDCRYWPVSVWIMFMGGNEELDKFPALAKEYQTRLDFHAVGITVLEILMSLLPTIALGTEEMWSLQAAWNQYWQDATRFWKRTMEVFDSGEDPAELKRWIRTEGRVVETLGADLAVLRGALRRARDACGRAAPGTLNYSQDASQLFRTLLELVSNSGKAGQEDSLQSPNWQVVRSLIDGDLSMPTLSAPKTTSIVPTSSVPIPTVTTALANGSSQTTSRQTFSSSYCGSIAVPAGRHVQEWRTRSCSPMPIVSRGIATPVPHYSAVRVVR
jgi:serine/threonine protein kinase